MSQAEAHFGQVLLIDAGGAAQPFVTNTLKAESLSYAGTLTILQTVSEACELLNNRRFDVDLILFVMAHKNTTSMTDLKTLCESAAAPVLVLSEDASLDFAMTALQQGAHDCLALSFLEPAAFIKAVSFAAHRHDREKNLRAELQEKAQTEKRLEAVLMASPSPIVMVDSMGVIQLVNSATTTLFQYTRGELIGKSVNIFIPDDVKQRHPSLFSSYFSDPQTRAMGKGRDLEGQRKDGSRVPVEIGLSPVRTEKATYVLAAIVDLTERKIAQKTLHERAEALARSNKELDAFAYVASHDLKAPLRGVSQLAQFIKEDAGDQLPPDSRKDLDMLQTRVIRMSQLLDGLLQFSRVGRKEGLPEPLNMSEVIHDTIELFVPTESFTVHIQEDLPTLFAPKVAIEQVFRNLLMNCVKHHDEQTGSIWITGHSDNTEVHYFVRDDGPGIDKMYETKIFEVFQTLKSRDELEATGIGLALVKKIVELYNGRVLLEHPSEGKGATFHLIWPKS
ncbi:PAS domain-containing sensor histidine kinase [Sneathiella aquimaris]|uniref:PAS domain-containing sensor histidine kinase n=1 Tax=Sneathiella aquimaris TaxID=2599305 RepID=UPI00146F7AF9|nr:PAS domain-containing sensor histidine kinase [Sneathiella aquimaris]